MGDEGQDSTEELQVLRDEIVKAQSDQARKKELLHRLNVKLYSLRDEVAERGKEVELKRREMEMELRRTNDPKQQSKGKDERLLEARNDLVKNTAMRALVRNIPKLAEQDKEEEDDSGPAAAVKDKDDKKEEKQHETCLVSYVEVKNFQIIQYEATFRIDQGTTIYELHVDTCEYWGSSQREFILCKCGREDYDGQGLPVPKNLFDPELLEKLGIDPEKEGSLIKVLDNKQAAHLYLAQSSQMAEWTDQMRADEAKRKKKEKEAVKAPTEDEEGADADKDMASIVANQQNQVEPYVRAFLQWPGIYHLLALRKRDDMVPRIFCREVLLYFVLGLITALIFNFRNANAYFMMHGVDELLVDGLTGYNFNHIQTPEHTFMWLRSTFASEIFNPNSTLQKNYQPVGVLRLRQQKVKKTLCARYKVAVAMNVDPHDCYYIYAKPDTYEKKPVLVNISLWLQPNRTGRISDVMAVRKHSDVVAEDAPWPSQPYPLHGRAQAEYGGTGMIVDYLLDRGNLTETGMTFMQDLDVLQKYWITSATRMLMLEMVMVNVHFDRFINLAFLLELAPSGRVVPTPIIRAFSAGEPTDGEAMAGNMDLVRAILVFYIFLLKGYWEITYKMAQEHSGFHYVFSILGFLDAMTVATFLSLFYARMNMGDVSPLVYYGKGQTKFRSYFKSSWTYEMTFVTEAVFFLLITIRFASFMRLSKGIFIFGKMFKMALKDYYFFGILLVPLFFGMVFLAHSIWSPYIYGFSTWSEALTSLLTFIKNDLSISDLNRESRVWCGFFMAIFFLMIICFFVNALVGIVVHAYFNTQLLYGFNRKTYQGWSSNQWMYWMLTDFFFTLLGGTSPDDELGGGEMMGDEDEMSEGEMDEEGGE